MGAMASLLAIGAAAAADLPIYKAPPPPPPPSIYNWTGGHVGVVGGYGGGSAAYTSYVTTFLPALTANFANTSRGTSGFLVGFESGYSWQFANNVVLGYESEFNYADISTSNSGWGAGQRTRLNWFGAERVRLGYAFGRFLPYITGGLAYGQLKTGGVDGGFGGLIFASTSYSVWQAGWTVGAGLEYAVLDNVSIKAEYLYSSMNGPNGASLALPNGYRTFRGNGFDTNMARVGVNYQIKNFGALIGMPQLGI
jgi:outer membrane immunogenic protein